MSGAKAASATMDEAISSTKACMDRIRGKDLEAEKLQRDIASLQLELVEVDATIACLHTQNAAKVSARVSKYYIENEQKYIIRCFIRRNILFCCIEAGLIG